MDREDAKKLLETILAERKRWGKMGRQFDSAQQEMLLEAVGVILGDDAPVVPKEEHTKVQRQLTAAKAREAKLNKRIEELTK